MHRLDAQQSATRRRTFPVARVFPSGLSLRVEDNPWTSAAQWAASVVVVLLWLGPPALGDTTVSFPTDGHYRPGRYLPVRVQGAAGRGTLTFAGRGMVSTQVSDADTNDVLLPWLPVADVIDEAHWQSGDGADHPLTVRFRALGADERLVAFAGTPTDAGQLLFPGNTTVPVTLDTARPLLDPVEPWECLDAVVLSAAAAARVDETHRVALLAAGTAIAVRSSARPDDGLPWVRVGDYWVARYAPAGPASIVEPDAYSPTYEWERGWPARFRHAVFFAAVLFCILAMAVPLWRSRWAAPAFLALAALSGAAFAAWYARQSPMLERTCAIRFENAGVTQFDLWTWLSPVRPADGSFPAAALTRPAFATSHQPEQIGVRLMCSADGRPERFTFHLEPGQSLAMCSRELRVGAATPPPGLARASRPFADFAEALYGGRDARIEGQYTARGGGAGPDAVPVIVVRRAGP